ncbi:glycosyltransferase family 4 protein [Algoriphagus resistens]|uniref:glycosyltransferase family 4 protein n=1 Tax=Algoriphagus resistens TaxID=1750590 RepID=UPI000716886A|nr:glycosyltransferase family 4 protein [Algoriphagus resistens]
MKIIQLIQKPQRRGAEIFAAQLSEQLRRNGNGVLLVSIYEGVAELSFNGEWIKLKRPIANRFFDYRGWRDFANLVKEFQPDVIQANAADTLKFSVFSKILFRWKVPLIYRNANQMGDFIRNAFHQRFNQFLVNQVTSVVSVSKESRTDFHQTFSFPQDNSIEIPIGIVPEEIELMQQEKDPVDLPKSFIIQIGSWVPEKDPLGMLQIFKEVLKSRPDLQLVFMGSGPLAAKIHQSIEDLGLKHAVHLIASQPNIFAYLQYAEALVMPSQIEGLPGVILEAMYCKVPVVAYGVGGIPEVLSSGQTGWCIQPSDQKAFCEAIVEILNSSKTQKSTIIDQAHTQIITDFKLSQIASRFEDFYRSYLR